MTRMHATVPFSKPSKSSARPTARLRRDGPPADRHATESGTAGELLSSSSTALIGRCIASHEGAAPEGRYPIRFRRANGPARTGRLLALSSVEPLPGDRVLLIEPANLAEPVIVGILGRGDRAERGGERSLRLRADEPLAVTDCQGHRLLEIRSGEAGPVVRLLEADVAVEMPGALRLSAEAISLEARSGDVCIESESDVVVRGTTIRLN